MLAKPEPIVPHAQMGALVQVVVVVDRGLSLAMLYMLCTDAFQA